MAVEGEMVAVVVRVAVTAAAEEMAGREGMLAGTALQHTSVEIVEEN